jgi:hypothetical protein
VLRRIYISGPITGTTDYKQRFEETERKLKETFPDADIVNPVKITESLVHFTHDEYLRVCIAALSCCNIIYIMKGWKHSAGACEEVKYAMEHVFMTIDEEKVLDEVESMLEPESRRGSRQ